MRGNVNPIIAVFAIIGALVILGLVLRVAFALIGLAIVVGRGAGDLLFRPECHGKKAVTLSVMPAKAGISCGLLVAPSLETPAFAGVTLEVRVVS